MTVTRNSRCFSWKLVKRGPSLLCALLSFLFICPESSARTVDPELKKALTQRAAFSADQITALERGGVVVQLIPASDQREVAVCGVMDVPSDPETALKAFQLTLSQLKQESSLQSGSFSNPPRVEDLGSLTLSDRDIEDLKTCSVGDCKLKLSAAMIRRFQQSIDWTAVDYYDQANRLFRLMIVEYVTEYLQRGDAALIEYADQSTRVTLAREQASLLTNLLYVDDVAPEFIRQLKTFPRSSGPVKHSLTWATINFGLKPVLVINDVSTYRSEVDGVPRVLVLSKQIYADHYIDASLSLTAVIGDHSGTSSHLLYVNHSRAGALASMFSKFKRQIVEGKSTDNLEDLLQQTRLNIDVVLNNGPASFEPTLPERTREWYAMRIIPGSGFLILIGILLFGTFNRKMLHFRKE
jgi:hypothetical protein